MKAHLDEKITHVEELLEGEIERLDERHSSFTQGVAQRFVEVNEFRGSLDDLGKTMATRRELETLATTVNERLDGLRKDMQTLTSRVDIGPSGLQALQVGAGVQQGRQEGVKVTTGTLFASVACFATIVGLFVLGARVLDTPAPTVPPVTVTVPTEGR